MDLNNPNQLDIQHLDYFQYHYTKIWDLYKRYGEKILEVDLYDTEDEIKKFFITSNDRYEFINKLITFWKNKYQVIINKPSDLLKALALNRSDITVDNDGQSSLDSLVFVSKTFFKKLKENSSKNLVYILIDEKLYIIKISEDNNYIKIQNIIPQKNILRD